MWWSLLLACGIEIGVGLAAAERADADLDGFRPADGDCDDARADVFPGAPEVCDGLDQSCDGSIDEGPLGVSTCARTEDLLQVASTDLLIVLDDSPGMGEIHAHLAEAAGALLTPLLLPSADVHVAVATTGAVDDPAGVLRDVLGRNFVDQGTGVGAATDWLQVAVTPGEQPVDAESARAIVAAAVLDPTEADAGFGRPWAALTVLIVSDEDDDSLHPDLTTLLDALSAQRGLGRTTVHAIVGTGDPRCLAEFGTDHLALVGLTGGTSASICLDDQVAYAGAVGQVALQAGLKDLFHLAEMPVPSSIEVSIILEDGTPIDLDPSDWVWQPEIGSLWLVGYVPPAGSRVHVDYLRAP